MFFVAASHVEGFPLSDDPPPPKVDLDSLRDALIKISLVQSELALTVNKIAIAALRVSAKASNPHGHSFGPDADAMLREASGDARRISDEAFAAVERLAADWETR